MLLSTSYLDEAERCGQVVVLHQGKVLAQGAPSEVSAAGRRRARFLAEPPRGEPARELQARLLDDPASIDAVPEGGRVRVVLGGAADRRPRAEASSDLVPARNVAAGRRRASRTASWCCCSEPATARAAASALDDSSR